MKVKQKIQAILLIMVMLVTALSVTVKADNNYSVGMALTSNSKLKAGATITVSVNLTSINAGNGIDGIEAGLEYDKNVFEEITDSSLKSSNDWIKTYAPTTQRMTFYKNTKVTKPETVATFTFKVKDTLNVNSTKITLKDIKASGGIETNGGTGDITVDNAVLTLTAETANSTTNTTTSNTVKKDNTVTTSTKLPKTGLGQAGIISIVVVSIISIFSYILYKKTSKIVK